MGASVLDHDLLPFHQHVLHTQRSEKERKFKVLPSRKPLCTRS